MLEVFRPPSTWVGSRINEWVCQEGHDYIITKTNECPYCDTVLKVINITKERKSNLKTIIFTGGNRENDCMAEMEVVKSAKI